MENLISRLEVENSAINCLTTVLEGKVRKGFKTNSLYNIFNIHGKPHITIGG